MEDKARIAIVDDDTSFRLALEGLVRSLGHAAIGFASAEAFLRSAMPEHHGYDWVITDIQMPGMGGIALKRRLSALGIATPVIMVTARTEADLHAEAMESGAVCVIRKPFDPEHLVRCIDKALGR